MPLHHKGQLSLVIGRIRQFTSRVPKEHTAVMQQFILDIMWAYGASIENTDDEYCHTWDQNAPFASQPFEWLSSDAETVLEWIDGSKDLPE